MSRHSRLRVEGELVGSVMTRQPVTVDAAATIHEAARRMRDADVGDVVVIERGRVAGILTDRDIVVRVIAERRDPLATACGHVASRNLSCVAPSTSIPDAVMLMGRQSVRRLPVVDGGRLAGIIGLADLALEREPGSLIATLGAAPASD